MSTFVFKNNNFKYTPVSNIFIDKFMPKARGEFVKVYLLGLKYCTSGEIGVTSEILASTLHLLETDVMNAWNYWDDEGVIKIHNIDTMGNFSVEFLNLENSPTHESDKINLLDELNNTSIKDMLQDIEKLLSRPLSSKEMTMYIEWIKEYKFQPELILLLIQYCASKNKTDWRYIEKIAISWFDEEIKTIDAAQSYIKRHEDKWVKIKKILNYLGIKDGEVMKPQEEMLTKWINVYKLPLNVIFKGCDICFQRISKCDFRYIDGILTNWYKNGLNSLEKIAVKDKKKSYSKNKNYYNKQAKVDNFNNFDQRDYDFKELEKKLLGWDK
ncbi:DnaD domain protein [Clostridium oceanicum]|uniref:DnaD domain-containing protein n=1 Tax=Clostridium oceanicum TaxID=1543 RepID=UPI0031DF3E8B